MAEKSCHQKVNTSNWQIITDREFTTSKWRLTVFKAIFRIRVHFKMKKLILPWVIPGKSMQRSSTSMCLWEEVLQSRGGAVLTSGSGAGRWGTTRMRETSEGDRGEHDKVNLQHRRGLFTARPHGSVRYQLNPISDAGRFWKMKETDSDGRRAAAQWRCSSLKIFTLNRLSLTLRLERWWNVCECNWPTSWGVK